MPGVGQSNCLGMQTTAIIFPLTVALCAPAQNFSEQSPTHALDKGTSESEISAVETAPGEAEISIANNDTPLPIAEQPDETFWFKKLRYSCLGSPSLYPSLNRDFHARCASFMWDPSKRFDRMFLVGFTVITLYLLFGIGSLAYLISSHYKEQ